MKKDNVYKRVAVKYTIVLVYGTVMTAPDRVFAWSDKIRIRDIIRRNSIKWQRFEQIAEGLIEQTNNSKQTSLTKLPL